MDLSYQLLEIQNTNDKYTAAGLPRMPNWPLHVWPKNLYRWQSRWIQFLVEKVAKLTNEKLKEVCFTRTEGNLLKFSKNNILVHSEKYIINKILHGGDYQSCQPSDN